MKSVGKIIYSPYTHLSSSKNWAVLMCDDEISRYYRHLFSVEFPWKGKLIRPVWGAHISWIRNERIPNDYLWGLDDGKIVEFDYEGGVKDNGVSFWLNVTCDHLLHLRNMYNLRSYPRFGLHLSIGKLYF